MNKNINTTEISLNLWNKAIAQFLSQVMRISKRMT